MKSMVSNWRHTLYIQQLFPIIISISSAVRAIISLKHTDDEMTLA